MFTTIILVFLSVILIILLTSVLKLNAFVSLFLVSILLALVTNQQNISEILKKGFGNTMGSVGLIIIAGAFIAVIIEKSGAAFSIANYIFAKTRAKSGAVAIGITGFLAGMPIFCDSGFIILSSLAKSFSIKAKTGLAFIAIVLATSLYSVHCLIPTHPGVLAAAGVLNVNIGKLILFGTIFAVPAALVAYFWTKWLTRHEKYDQSLEENYINEISEDELPPVLLSLLPIVVPLLLITLNTVLSAFGIKNDSTFTHMLFFAGQPVMALSVGVILALLLLKDIDLKKINGIFESAISKSGSILIVIAGGGMYGEVIRETGIGTGIGSLLNDSGLGLLIPFLIAFLLKSAQGSTTIAIITAVSFIAPLLSPLGLNSESGRLFTVLAMGAGSMMISHANDAYFWVVTRFTGLKVETTLKVYSSATAVMGLTVFGLILLSSLFFL